MRLQYLMLLVTIRAEAGNIDLHGEISLKIQVPGEPEPRVKRTEEQESSVADSGSAPQADGGAGSGRSRPPDRMTEAPVLECIYQFPEEAQVHALLSNMMNQLTKMFVRASDMLRSEEEGAGWRRRGSRFQVVSKTNTDFFEDIYRKMTHDYLSFYNSTAVRAARAAAGGAGGAGGAGDECRHQQQMKDMWRELLDNSLTTFRQAAFRCIDANLRARGGAGGAVGESRARNRLAQYVVRELRKIRRQQLALLCDQFQLCYHELVRRSP